MGRAYSIDLREKALKYIEQGGQKREAAKVFNVGEDTIYRWVRANKSGCLAAKKRVWGPKKMDVEKLKQHISDNADHTLEEIGRALKESGKTAWVWFNRLGITRKKRQHCIKESKRQEFAKIIKDINKRTIVHIDEAGIDNRLYREHGRATRGQKVYGEISGKRKERVSIIGALMNKRLIAPLTFKGGCRAESINIWLEQVLLKLVALPLLWTMHLSTSLAKQEN